MPPLHEQFKTALPRLTPDSYRVTSPASGQYNCIAWAVGVADAWWWPEGEDHFWPAGVPLEPTLPAFVSALTTVGFTVCDGPALEPALEPGVEKVALYAKDQVPTHAARQLPSGLWTSKLGPHLDIEHTTLDVIAGGVYGEPLLTLRRPVSICADPSTLTTANPVTGIPPVPTINSVPLDDTFAEAFPMTAARLVVTAASADWARTAALSATGYAASVIGCDCEAGVERELPPAETPDGRPGLALLFFAFSRDALTKALVNRVGQCILTCPTTACYNGLPVQKDRAVRVGGSLRFFGDTFQFSKFLDGRRFWRLPVMDGEFVCEDLFGTVKGVAGGNFLILARSQADGLAAAEAAIAAVKATPGVIAPFPGGVVRSGSKIGSRYKKLKASTNDAYCPTLRPLVKSALPPEVGAVYEIVIDGVDLAAVGSAMRAGVRAACRPGVVRITAGNYGGKLGPFHLHLHKLLAE